MTEDRYFAKDQEYKAERERLELMADKLDPTSIRHLEMLNIAPGWDCLEIGAGTGSIAYWLAERVQPDGTVTAIDINPRFLDEGKYSNLTVRKHNVLTDDLEEDSYDLIHCRYVFSHLKSDQNCLERMARALRPGGILLIIDADWSFARMANINHIDSGFLAKMVNAFSQAAEKAGILDPYCGGNLREKLDGLGLIDVMAEGTFPISRGGDATCKLFLRNAEIFKPQLVSTGELNEQDFRRLETLVDNPSNYISGTPTIAAWGRKPE